MSLVKKRWHHIKTHHTGVTTAILLLAVLVGLSGCQSEQSSPAATDAIPSKPGLSLGIASVPNLRDLGGYATRDGATVVRGLVYRSNQLAPISPGDMKKFAELGFKNDYDLRTEAERTPLPDELPPGVNNVWLNVLKDDSGAGPAQILALLQNPNEANKALGGGQMEATFVKSYRDFVSCPAQRPLTASSLLRWPTRTSCPHCFTAQRVRIVQGGRCSTANTARRAEGNGHEGLPAQQRLHPSALQEGNR